jgi:hypothetical protein
MPNQHLLDSTKSSSTEAEEDTFIDLLLILESARRIHTHTHTIHECLHDFGKGNSKLFCKEEGEGAAERKMFIHFFSSTTGMRTDLSDFSLFLDHV